MILLFLGSWRSTLVVITSIPLSIPHVAGDPERDRSDTQRDTSAGSRWRSAFLVDDRHVEIENIHRKPAASASGWCRRSRMAPADRHACFRLDLSICIVFVPVVSSPAREVSLSRPGDGRRVAMLASYLLSRTIVPTLVRYLLATSATAPPTPAPRESLRRFHDGFQGAGSSGSGWRTSAPSRPRSPRRRRVFGAFAVVVVSGLAPPPLRRRDFFPTVDTGQFRLHFRAPAGTRIEEPSRCSRRRGGDPPAHSEDEVQAGDRQHRPAAADQPRLTDSVTPGPSDGEILVLAESERHQPTERWMKTLRETLPREFPGVTFFFQPADIVSQILTSGCRRRSTCRSQGSTAGDSRDRLEVAARMSRIPGAADVHLHQWSTRRPCSSTSTVAAAEAGLTQRDVASTILVTLSSSAGRRHQLLVRSAERHQLSRRRPDAPEPGRLRQTRHEHVADPGHAGPPSSLSNLATLERGRFRRHQPLQRAAGLDIHANVAGPGSRQCPPAPSSRSRPSSTQAATRSHDRRTRPGGEHELCVSPRWPRPDLRRRARLPCWHGRQLPSWLDPFIIITALPAGFSGIVWLPSSPTPRSACPPSWAPSWRRRRHANSILVVSVPRRTRDAVDGQ